MTQSFISGSRQVGRPKFPEGYGIPEHTDNLIAWEWVQTQMQQAKNVWVCTVRPDNRPHCMPVWGVWVDDTLYIEGSLQTRRAQNLLANPYVSVHLESGNEVVIVEGMAQEVKKPEPSLGQQLSTAYCAKYSSQGYSPTPNQWDEGGLFAIHPHTVMAWTHFPEDVTKFTLPH